MYLPHDASAKLVEHILDNRCYTSRDVEHYESLVDAYSGKVRNAADPREQASSLVLAALVSKDDMNIAAALRVASELDSSAGDGTAAEARALPAHHECTSLDYCFVCPSDS